MTNLSPSVLVRRGERSKQCGQTEDVFRIAPKLDMSQCRISYTLRLEESKTDLFYEYVETCAGYTGHLFRKQVS